MTTRMDILALIVGIVIILGVVSLGWFVSYEWSTQWSDTGHVTWVGQKQFNPDSGVLQWKVPFAITTTNHGTMNFTSNGQTIGPFGCWPINVSTIDLNGTLFGIYKTHYGCVELVEDP